MPANLDPSAASVQRTPDTVFFVGDSITVGWRDEEIRGWPSRVVAALGLAAGVTAYNLGIRGDTSDNILARWQDEVRRRLRPQASTVIVFAFGANDAKGDASGKLRIPPDALRHNVRRILGLATADHRVLFVGPAPIDEEALARVLNSTGLLPMPSNRRIRDVSEVLSEEAAAAGVPYLDLVTRLGGDIAWSAAIRTTDGLHPPAIGYDILAGHVAAWRPWASLFGSPSL